MGVNRNKSIVFLCLLIINLVISGVKPPVSVFAQTTTPVQINGLFNPDTIYPSQTSRLTINVYNPNTLSWFSVKWKKDH